jgi:hypothetical protein
MGAVMISSKRLNHMFRTYQTRPMEHIPGIALQLVVLQINFDIRRHVLEIEIIFLVVGVLLTVALLDVVTVEMNLAKPLISKIFIIWSGSLTFCR